MAKGFNYGDIARVAWGLKTDELTLFAGILESITEGNRVAVTAILKNLVDGTVGQTLPEDARQLLITIARSELGLIK